MTCATCDYEPIGRKPEGWRCGECERGGAATDRLEYLRGQIRAECISYGEIAELEGLARDIDPGDVELLEWAGVPEFAAYDEPTTYYIVAVDRNGDVLTTRAALVGRDGLDITIRTAEAQTDAFEFENQGPDSDDKFDAARDALAAVMPSDDEEV